MRRNAVGTDPNGNIDSEKMTVYTAKTELVYRFNWGGPVVAKNILISAKQISSSKAPAPSGAFLLGRRR